MESWHAQGSGVTRFFVALPDQALTTLGLEQRKDIVRRRTRWPAVAPTTPPKARSGLPPRRRDRVPRASGRAGCGRAARRGDWGARSDRGASSLSTLAPAAIVAAVRWWESS